MIKHETVFILGAGASKPYGFPTGLDLLKLVGHGLLDHTKTNAILEEMGFSKELQEDFGIQLLASQKLSVDAFIEGRTEPEFIELGKAAIASFLIPFENISNLLERKREITWYQYLFNQIGGNPGDFNYPNISIITFNYDRSFEYFFLHALMNSSGLNEQQTAIHISNIPIVHIYGKLAEPHFINSNGRSFHHEVTRKDVEKSFENIKIVSEVTGETEEIRKSREIIYGARKLIIIGFGYHDVNIERLGLPRSFRGSGNGYMGTATGLKRDEIRRTKERMSLRGRRLEFMMGSDQEKAIDFIRNYPVFD